MAAVVATMQIVHRATSVEVAAVGLALAVVGAPRVDLVIEMPLAHVQRARIAIKMVAILVAIVIVPVVDSTAMPVHVMGAITVA